MFSFQGMGQAALGAVPALGEITDQVLFGEVWEREGLGKRERSLVTVACLLSLYRPEQLAFHLGVALQNGVTRRELEEVVTHLAFYAGWPAAATGARLLGELDAVA